jgi:hypothetical protein
LVDSFPFAERNASGKPPVGLGWQKFILKTGEGTDVRPIGSQRLMRRRAISASSSSR